jgi:cell division septation protein DedD
MYALGGIDHLALLDTERNYYRYLDDFHRSNMEYLRSYLVLFHSLGSSDASGDAVSFESAVAQKRPWLKEKAQFVADGADVLVADQTNPLVASASAAVELVGLYHRDMIGPLWRDLRRRFPAAMSSKSLLPRVAGRIESAQGKQSWYRVKIAGFSDDEADRFCRVLLKGLQRCKVSWATGGNSGRTAVSAGEPGLAASSPQMARPVNAFDKAVVNMDVGKPDVLDAKVVAGNGADQSPVRTESATASAVPIKSSIEEVGSLTPEDSRLASDRANQPAAKSDVIQEIAERAQPERGYSVQFGVFAVRENASNFLSRWKSQGYPAFLAEISDSVGRKLFAVRAGAFGTKSESAAYARTIEKKEGIRLAVVQNVSVKRGLLPAE